MKTHPVNVSYLVVGLILLGLSGSWALREAGFVDLGAAPWLLPATLAVAGVVGLIAFASRRLQARRDREAEPGYETGTSNDPEREIQ